MSNLFVQQTNSDSYWKPSLAANTFKIPENWPELVILTQTIGSDVRY